MGLVVKLVVLAVLCWVTSGTPMDPSPSNQIQTSSGLFINGRQMMTNFHRHRRSLWKGLLEVLRDAPDTVEATADLLARKQRDVRSSLSSSLYNLLAILGQVVSLFSARPVNYSAPCQTPVQYLTPVSYQQEPQPAQQYQPPQSGSRLMEDLSIDKIVDIVGKLMKKRQGDSQNYE